MATQPPRRRPVEADPRPADASMHEVLALGTELVEKLVEDADERERREDQSEGEERAARAKG